jgi:hypothetical protein
MIPDLCKNCVFLNRCAQQARYAATDTQMDSCQFRVQATAGIKTASQPETLEVTYPTAVGVVKEVHGLNGVVTTRIE